jgi:hypothetical protein
MNKPTLYLATVVLVSSLTFTIAQSKYSGIYSGNAAGIKFIAAVTAGGRVLALDNGTEGLRDAVDPTKSTVNSKGAIKAVVPNGTSLTGTINSSFRMSGTIKNGSQSARFSGNRILK